MHTLLGLAMLLGALSVGCGRYFAGPIQPAAVTDQSPRMEVRDDGTVAYVYERLEVSLRPLTDAELNRTFPAESSKGAQSTNPFTYGNWVPLGESWTPSRFTVFLLRVKNYAYPKVRIDPQKISIRSDNRREYQSLDHLRLNEYYRAHALAWAGNAHARYRTSDELIRRTLYAEKMVFSGQEDEGYVVFPTLPPDVTDFAVTIDDVVLRFDYADEPVETVGLSYRFRRDVHKGYEPPAELVEAR